MSVSIEKEVYGGNEHLTLRVGKHGIRVTRADLEGVKWALQEFDFENSSDLRQCPECGCEDQWESNNCVLEMRCCNCDHEEKRDYNAEYFNEEHELI